VICSSDDSEKLKKKFYRVSNNGAAVGMCFLDNCVIVYSLVPLSGLLKAIVIPRMYYPMLFFFFCRILMLML
jgi:hypothetical protein